MELKLYKYLCGFICSHKVIHSIYILVLRACRVCLIAQLLRPAPVTLSALTQHVYPVNGCSPFTVRERTALFCVFSERRGARTDVHTTVYPVTGEN